MPRGGTLRNTWQAAHAYCSFFHPTQRAHILHTPTNSPPLPGLVHWTDIKVSALASRVGWTPHDKERTNERTTAVAENQPLQVGLLLWRVMMMTIHCRSEGRGSRCVESSASFSSHCISVWQTAHDADHCPWRVLATASARSLCHQCKMCALLTTFVLGLIVSVGCLYVYTRGNLKTFRTQILFYTSVWISVIANQKILAVSNETWKVSQLLYVGVAAQPYLVMDQSRLHEYKQSWSTGPIERENFALASPKM